MLAASLVLWSLAGHATPVPAGDGAAGWLEAVVLVEQGSTSCAGAVASPEGDVVTAYHCVAPGGRPRVTLRDGRRAVGRVSAVDVAADLALIRVDALSGEPWLPLSETAPEVGDRVVVLGHPLAADAPVGFLAGTLRWSAAEGIVSAVGPVALQLSAPVNPGNSGGPVVRDGEVVGVVSRRLGGDGLGFAGRAERVRPLLDGDRGLGPVGGTLALELALTSHERGGGSFAAGGRAELALRDRVLLRVAAEVPLSARWDAARFGSTSWLPLTALGGLRQRVGRGPWTVRLDGMAGLALLQDLVADPDDPLHLTTRTEPTWLVGGAVRVRSVGFEVGWLADGGTFTTSLVLRVPGVVAVF